MIKVDIKKSEVERFCRDLDLAFAEFDRAISFQFDGFAHNLFRQLVETTPQWSGDLAEAWNFSTGAPNMSYTPNWNKESYWRDSIIYQRGEEPAVSAAVRRSEEIRVTWRDKVFFHNPAPIAAAVEVWPYLATKGLNIRPVNLVNGAVAMVTYHRDRWSSRTSWDWSAA